MAVVISGTAMHNRTMASLTARSLYCDETRTDGGGPFFLGVLDCSPRRAELLTAAVDRVRQDHRCHGEMKWTKVSGRMLPVYKAFADVFLQDRYARFSVMRVERNVEWRSWARTNEERFFRTYYAFLRRVMSGYCRYDVHLDHLQANRWRWDSLRYALRGAALRDEYAAGKRLVPRLRAVDSKTSDLLQLTDVLLGAWTAAPSSPHKTALQAHIRERAGSRVEEWTFLREG